MKESHSCYTLTKVNRTILQSIQFVQPASDRDVANEMKDVFVFFCHILIELKHLLSESASVPSNIYSLTNNI